MIDQEKLSIAWIEKVSRTNRNADKILVEKSIRALLLVEGLVKQKLRFVFKGGTAVMLHLNSAKRLSIDVDICIPEKPVNLNTILDHVAKEQGFLRKEEQKRKTEIRIDKAHYKFYYTPLHKTIQEEEFLLLDILFESSHYEKTIQLPVQSAFVPEHGSPLYVEVPCPENLLGLSLFPERSLKTSRKNDKTGFLHCRDQTVRHACAGQFPFRVPFPCNFA